MSWPLPPNERIFMTSITDLMLHTTSQQQRMETAPLTDAGSLFSSSSKADIRSPHLRIAAQRRSSPRAAQTSPFRFTPNRKRATIRWNGVVRRRDFYYVDS